MLGYGLGWVDFDSGCSTLNLKDGGTSYINVNPTQLHWISLSTWGMGQEQIHAISDFAL